MKNQKQKHYIGTIDERNGEMEYNTDYLFKTRGCPHKYNHKVARGWRYDEDSEYDKGAGGYWSDNNLISVGGVQEIPASHFAILKKYLSVL